MGPWRSSTSARRAFPPVRVRAHPDGRLHATPVRYHSSGDYASLGASHGFVELDRGRSEFPAGTVAPFYPWEPQGALTVTTPAAEPYPPRGAT